MDGSDCKALLNSAVAFGFGWQLGVAAFRHTDQEGSPGEQCGGQYGDPWGPVHRSHLSFLSVCISRSRRGPGASSTLGGDYTAVRESVNTICERGKAIFILTRLWPLTPTLPLRWLGLNLLDYSGHPAQRNLHLPVQLLPKLVFA